MKSSALPYWLTLVVVLVAAYGFARVWRGEEQSGPAGYAVSTPVSPADRVPTNLPPVGAFTLTASDGELFRSKSLEGQVWVASFFYSSCPSACIRLNQGLASVHGDEAFHDVKFVSITCDPENDTPAVLAKYAERFDADTSRWFFCTGDFEYVKRIGNDMLQMMVERQTHANHAAVIDRAGEVRGLFNVTDERELKMMRRVLLECLAEGAPENPADVQAGGQTDGGEAVAAVAKVEEKVGL
jgi:cytochrome oxidase Cu insertion factor (SCO1/SenC/PrrC family)